MLYYNKCAFYEKKKKNIFPKIWQIFAEPKYSK